MLSLKGEIGVYKSQEFAWTFASPTGAALMIYETYENGSFLESIKIPITTGV